VFLNAANKHDSCDISCPHMQILCVMRDYAMHVAPPHLLKQLGAHLLRRSSSRSMLG
jgi:hypothetical protein